MNILSLSIGEDGPMVLVNMPNKFVWRKMWTRLTSLARSFGYLQKDVYIHEYLSSHNVTEEPWKSDGELINKTFVKAILGDKERLPHFYLYLYTEKEGFTSLRAALR